MVVNIYLFIELLRAASAGDVADHIKSLSLANCKFANVVVLSSEKLVAQLDCSTPEDGTKTIVEDIAQVEGVVHLIDPKRGVVTSSPWSNGSIDATLCVPPLFGHHSCESGNPLTTDLKRAGIPSRGRAGP